MFGLNPYPVSEKLPVLQNKARLILYTRCTKSHRQNIISLSLHSQIYKRCFFCYRTIFVSPPYINLLYYLQYTSYTTKLRVVKVLFWFVWIKKNFVFYGNFLPSFKILKPIAHFDYLLHLKLPFYTHLQHVQPMLNSYTILIVLSVGSMHIDLL